MTNWLNERQQQAWRTFIRADRRLVAALSRQLLAESSLSMPDFEVLVLLTDAESGQERISDLARALDWERSRLSHHLKRMEKRKLISRADCDDDGRGSFAVITPEGRAAIEQAAPGHVDAVRRWVVDVLSDDELDQLAALAAKIQAAVDDLEPTRQV
ncbi:MAG TPA: MarR family winged helix-turn-helix transcriptional regulator [Marmoricola sp.]|nr:MarR family winged helix-turn-helix transcriptional regulator [Marmoricola sp.]